jgi:hypothetical protein
MPSALHEDQYTFLIISRSILLRTKCVSDKSCGEHLNRYFVFSNFFFFLESVPFMKYVEKYGRAGQATDGNMAHAHCMMDN